MKTRTWMIVVSAALLLTAALILPSLTSHTAAQSANMLSGQTYGLGAGKQRGPVQGNTQGMSGAQQMGTQQSLIAVAAQVLGMTQDDLLTQLQPDKSIADVAGDKTQTVIDTFVQQQSERITAMVNAGRLTQAEADQRLAAMKGMVTGRVYQNWATGVQGPPEGMAVGQERGQGNGQGLGMGHGAANGSCDGSCANSDTSNNHIDSDGDGVCDNVGTNQGTGMRHGRGR